MWWSGLNNLSRYKTARLYLHIHHDVDISLASRYHLNATTLLPQYHRTITTLLPQRRRRYPLRLRYHEEGVLALALWSGPPFCCASWGSRTNTHTWWSRSFVCSLVYLMPYNNNDNGKIWRTPIYPVPYSNDGKRRLLWIITRVKSILQSHAEYRPSEADCVILTTWPQSVAAPKLWPAKQTVSGRDWQRRELSWLIYWLLRLPKVLQEACPNAKKRKAKITLTT